MNRRLIFPVLLGLAGVGVLCSLGVWQVQRMQWKAGILAEITARIAAAPVALPGVPDPVGDRYLPVFVEGQFIDRDIDVLSSTRDGGPGVRVIAGFQTVDGRLIMVDRGYLPEDQRMAPRGTAAVRVVGNLQWPVDGDQYTPPPDARTGLWFSRDVGLMAAKLGAEATLIVAREPTGDGIQPMPVDTSGIPNDHWGYAITWFSLAAVWAGMTGYLLWRIRQRTV